jgi:survival of motor neuron-related-splicing factor 30
LDPIRVPLPRNLTLVTFQVEIVRTQLRDDSDNAELRALHDELDGMISLLDESITELRAKQAPKPAVVETTSTPPTKEKWSRENHPAFKKTAPVVEDKEEAAVTYQVNDNVLAKWLSGDKAFYPARITSITGSSTAPIYIVKFKNYDTTETLRAKDIRPISNKRKADGIPAPTSSTATPALPSSVPSTETPSTGVVASAAASMYPQQAVKRDAEQQGADAAANPPKSKKIKANKELEAGKSKWQEFSSKSKFGKTHKKDSMFRTGEGVNARGRESCSIIHVK